jgi:hypothetical protein
MKEFSNQLNSNFMQIQTASRKKVKIRMNIASPSGFGKTYSALRLAYGMTGNWAKIAVIDTEHDSASLYAHLGEFKTLRLDPPFSAERYIAAIDTCEKAGMELIIIDSITHIWKGQGGILEYQNSLGGRYQDWAKATPLYQKWLNRILQSPCHVITTNRKKQAYNLITEGNRTKVEKAGLDDEIREGYEYEMTLAFEIINEKHMAKVSKDRTGLFVHLPEFIITEETGKMILKWCQMGEAINESMINERIGDCKSIQELLSLYKMFPQYQQILKTEFEKRKREIIVQQEDKTTHIATTTKFNSNGKLH